MEVRGDLPEEVAPDPSFNVSNSVPRDQLKVGGREEDIPRKWHSLLTCRGGENILYVGAGWSLSSHEEVAECRARR